VSEPRAERDDISRKHPMILLTTLTTSPQETRIESHSHSTDSLLRMTIISSYNTSLSKRFVPPRKAISVLLLRAPSVANARCIIV
jgi:hypothetical protein